MFRIGQFMSGRHPGSLHSLLAAAKSGLKLFPEHCDLLVQKTGFFKTDCPCGALGRNNLGGADWVVHLVVGVIAVFVATVVDFITSSQINESVLFVRSASL